MNLNSQVSGEYKFVIARNGNTIKDTDWIPNIVTDFGLNALANWASSSSAPIRFCRVGTGTSTPIASNTALDAQIASTSSGVVFATSRTSSGAPNYQSTLMFTYTFTQGAVVGNITEVGVSSATTGSNLFSRALILDGGGSPTTLTLTSIDQLTVYYRIRFTPTLTDSSGTVTLGATSYPYQVRVCDVNNFFNSTALFNNYSNAFGVWGTGSAISTYAASGSGLSAITAASPLGTSSGSNSSVTVSYLTYTPGSFYLDSVVNWSVNDGNATGGIGAIRIETTNSGKFQFYFPTPIPKTNTQTLSLTFRTSWSR